MDRDMLGDRLDNMFATLDVLEKQLKQRHANSSSIEVWTSPRPYESLEGPHIAVCSWKRF